ncbi:hypothetical protein FJQ98_14120 [Lysinibacillus agricola]|uniref:HK97 gp10 family phage protein n=1 Tax=Lysinibacillus agricola TaxID=2590012 RepID=A0ABX7ALB2_9BACI|nr:MULTISPECIES: hypothetical protein [Lysinibacillus]KOS64629.1 hypothetical protein AN161_00980 [Lysinibacillus sp. FJAT-14222]QQP10424.1 hypothetical protein FJQ98_14120 [Lysinibacillus agricola]
MPLHSFKEKLDRKVAGLHALGTHLGKELEKDAKSTASWTDRTGATRAAIHGGADKTDNGTIIYIAHGAKVGMYHELGTGIYGPKKQPIVPKNKKALKFEIGGKTIVVKSVKGIKVNPVLKNTAIKHKGEIENAIRRYWES